MGLRETWPQRRPYTAVEEAFAAAMVERYREGYSEFDAYRLWGDAALRKKKKDDRSEFKEERMPMDWGKKSRNSFDLRG